MLSNKEEMEILIRQGALFVVSHSGGKDSQAMYALLRDFVPASQLVVIHADLGEVEFEGTQDHARKYIRADHPFSVVKAGKTFFDMVVHRGFWPSPKYRQCTSDLKRAPIEKEIRKIAKERGSKLIINCMGLRAQESASRKKLSSLKLNKSLSKAGRTAFDWLPIHALSTNQVWGVISGANEVGHWAYKAGMGRLSCAFCIMATKEDLAIAARLAPELYRKVARVEVQINQTFVMPSKGVRKFLPEITGFPLLGGLV